MLTRKTTFPVLIVLLLALQACNLPSSAPVEADLAATITAQAQLIESGSSVPSFEASSTPDLSFSPTPEFTATVTLTPTPSVPTVTVSQNTNCRTGPGVQFNLVASLLIGEIAEVVGKNTATNYWIIKTPGEPSSTCWLWGEYATVSGNVAALPEIPAPPTPTPAPPAAVSDLTANKVCIPLVLPNFQYTGTLTWKDKSSNEKGFYIYLNGALFATIGPDVTSYPIPPLVFPMGTPMKMGVEAFNDTGKSALKQVTFSCP